MKPDKIEALLRNMGRWTSANPSPEFRTNARIRLLNVISGASVKPTYVSWRARILRYVTASAGAAALLGTGVVYASQSSLPGHVLYPVKIASERVALGLAPSSGIKTSVATGVIDRRASEVEEINARGDRNGVKEAAARYEETVQTIRKESGINEEEVETHITEGEQRVGGIIRGEEQKGNDTETPEKSRDSSREHVLPLITPTIAPTGKVEGTSTEKEGDLSAPLPTELHEPLATTPTSSDIKDSSEQEKHH